MTEIWELKIYEQIGNDPKVWEACANDLITSADILMKNRFEAIEVLYNSIKAFENCIPVVGPGLEVIRTEIMLRGFAVECLLKAKWLKQDNKNKIVIQGRFNGDLPNGFINHDLVQLSKSLGFKFSEIKKYFLNTLTYFCRGLGRYPISRNLVMASTEKEQRILKKIKPPFGFFTTESDYRYLNEIIMEIRK